MIRKLKLKSLFLVLAILMLAVSCEKEDFETVEDKSQSGIKIKSKPIKELPSLHDHLRGNRNYFMAKSAETSNFSLFDDFEVSVISTDSTVTYTLPVISDTDNPRQFHNLVITYYKDSLHNSFLIKYEGTPGYFEKLKLERNTVFSGTMEMKKAYGQVDLFAKSQDCVVMTGIACYDVSDPAGEGMVHIATELCANGPNLEFGTYTVCLGAVVEYIDAGDTSDSGGGTPSGDESTSSGNNTSGSSYNSGWDGSSSSQSGSSTGGPNTSQDTYYNWPDIQNYTNPQPNPACGDGMLSNGTGGCVDPVELNRQQQMLAEFYSSLNDDALKWINGYEEKQKLFKSELENYLTNNMLNPKSLHFAEEAINSILEDSNTTINFNNEIINQLTGRAKNVLDLMLFLDKFFFKTVVRKNFASEKTSIIKFKEGPLSFTASDAPGFASTQYDSSISERPRHTVIINTERINELTNIEIANVIMHETMHVELMERCIELGIFTKINTLGNVFNLADGQPYLLRADNYFATMLKKYLEEPDLNSQWNHNSFSIENYREVMTNELLNLHSYLNTTSNFPPFSLSQRSLYSIFNYFTWSGLIQSDNYNSLNLLDKRRIQFTLSEIRLHYSRQF